MRKRRSERLDIHSLKQWFLIFLKSGNTFDYIKNLRNTTINDPKKTNKNIRRNKYILENILLNIFKFYILKYIIKFLQSHDNNKKENSAMSLSDSAPTISTVASRWLESSLFLLAANSACYNNRS